MKKQWSKRILTTAACVLTAVLSAAPLYASDAQGKVEDGDVQVAVDFEDGGTGSFMTYMNGGSCEIANEDGALAVHITNCGSLDYANQVYYDGFALNKGCIYTYSFDISSDIPRKCEYRIQLNGGDYHAYMSDRIDIGPDVQHVETDWTMEEDSDPAPRLVFNLGKMEDMAEDPGEHCVKIDNISLVVKDASGAEVLESLPAYPVLTLSQTGYLPGAAKTAFAKGDGEEGEQDFAVVDESGKVCFEGTFAAAAYDRASDERIREGDFSAFDEPGTYTVVMHDGGEEVSSYPFRIAENVYDDLFRGAVRMLYLQRCGTKTDPAIAGDFAHGACHMAEAVVYGTDKIKDVSGGWHDAGDYGRYVVAGAKAVSDLFLAYEAFGAEMDDIGIPESENGIPDLLDEARYELDFLLKMQDEESGLVYHKVTCYAFPGSVPPEEETDTLVISPVSTAATGDFAAVMAKAARIYADIDPAFAASADDAAMKAYAAIKDTEDHEGFTNPPEISTGEYPDRGTNDERFYAAAELYLAGHEELAGDLAALYSGNLKCGLGWAGVGGYAFYDLAFAAPEGLPELSLELKGRILGEADALIKKSEKDRYYMTLEKNYPWGSNMSVANNAMLLLFAGELSGEEAYRLLALRAVDYLTGANSLGISFVTGYGTHTPEHPHHRPSQAVGKAMPGMLAGGPDVNLEDSYAKGVLKDQAPAKCYVDNEQSYSTNEVTIYWNSPLITCLSAFLK